MQLRKTLIASLLIVGLNGNTALASSLEPPHDFGGTMSTNVASQESSQPQQQPMVEKYLEEGNLVDGQKVLQAHLTEKENDDQARFGLGVLQFLRALEQLGQDFYHYGLRDMSHSGVQIPFLRLQVPINPNPAKLSYAQARRIAETLVDNLSKADTTLAQITDANVKLPLHFGLIRLSFTGTKDIAQKQRLWQVYSELTHSGIQQEQAEQFFIKFDRGDVHWLRGYCHLLMSFCQIYLAYDSKETFDCTAHLFFPNVDSPYKFLTKGKHVHSLHGDGADVADFVALIHTIRWPLTDLKRMQSALHDLQTVAAQSKESWKWIMSETDDDHEWIPNPKQTGVIPNVHITDQMVNAWLNMMDQLDKVLAGEALVPFWRGDEHNGVNVRKVFMQPPHTLDVVLWVQGPAAAPYLETGKMTDGEVWRQIPATFGRNYPGFALWFN